MAMIGAKADYSPIPDAEEGLLTTTAAPSSERVYPRVANDAERKFLLALDDAIDDDAFRKPEIALPRLDAKGARVRVNPATNFMWSMMYPTAALVVMIGSAVAIERRWSGSSVAVALFPFLSCAVMFLSSIPATRDKLVHRANHMFELIEKVRHQAEEQVRSLSDRAVERMDGADAAMRDALSSVRERLGRAAELKSAMGLVDPDADVPDEDAADGVEAKFGELRDELSGAAVVSAEEGGREVVADAVLRGVPLAFRSRRLFRSFAMLPVMLGFLALELLAVYLRSRSVPEEEDVFGPVYYAIQTYFFVAVQLAFVYLAVSPMPIASFGNRIISRVEGCVNRVLDETVGTTYRSVFWRGFTDVRERMLSLLRRMEALEGPLREAERRREGGGDD